MKLEIETAASFIVSFTKGLGTGEKDCFLRCLINSMAVMYEDHWFPEQPLRGMGYRCITINRRSLDPLIYNVAIECAMSQTRIRSLFSNDITVWVDPFDVSYRIGEGGSVGVLLGEGKNLSRQTPKRKKTVPFRSCKDDLNLEGYGEALKSNRIISNPV